MDTPQKCFKCGEELKSHWTVCPNCSTQVLKVSQDSAESPIDTPPTVQKQKNPPIVYIALILVVILFIYGAVSSNTKTTTQPTTVPQNINSEAKTVATETKVENWKYSEKEDKIHNNKTKFAICKSTNTLNFEFPYSGTQHARLVVRQSYDGTKDVMIVIEQGQFMTSVFGGKALVRFDDKSPVEFSLVEPEDDSLTVVFIEHAENFITELEKSKKAYIQTAFYQEGSPTMEFNVEGLKMPL